MASAGVAGRRRLFWISADVGTVIHLVVLAAGAAAWRQGVE
jgi:hypothetical protein